MHFIIMLIVPPRNHSQFLLAVGNSPLSWTFIGFQLSLLPYLALLTLHCLDVWVVPHHLGSFRHGLAHCHSYNTLLVNVCPLVWLAGYRWVDGEDPVAFICLASLFLELTSTTITTYFTCGQSCCPLPPCSQEWNYSRISLWWTQKGQVIQVDAFPVLIYGHKWRERYLFLLGWLNWDSVTPTWSKLVFSLPWGESLHMGWWKHHLNSWIQLVMPETWTSTTLNS